ncbi:MAG: lysylphosphatidylglycerol synthase transmembrane domain-containing protein [Myxococcota bacterium]
MTGDPAAPAAGKGGARRWRDPRVWLGVAVTVFFLWLTLRDVPFAEVGRVMAGANWWLLVGLSVPLYALLVWLRALRWGHLTDPIQPIPRPSLARAVAVGFMANNVFPLRMGEVVRCWYLSREAGGSAAALFGTVILERIIDTIFVLLLVGIVVTWQGSSPDGVLVEGALLLLPVALLPIAGLLLLKAAPEFVIRVVVTVLRPLPRLERLAERLIRRLHEGLAALRGGRHLFWLFFHSAVLWLVVSPATILVGFLSLEIDLGSAVRLVEASWVTQAAVGVAVALPSAPGFFGLFHLACKIALLRFGVAPELAVAAGTLIHAMMWVTLTGMGLLVLRSRRTSLGEVEGVAVAASESPSE